MSFTEALVANYHINSFEKFVQKLKELKSQEFKK
jgi:hypothetical protein